MEIIDIYDYDHNRTGRTMVRGEEVKEGDYYLVAHLCIFNSEGKMLIQQRQMTKKVMPGVWDVSAGGFMGTGEDAPDGIVREAAEELGLKLESGDIKFLRTDHFQCVLDDFFILKRDIDLDTLTIQESELMAVKWESLDNILSMWDEQKFVDYDKDLLRACFEAGRAE